MAQITIHVEQDTEKGDIDENDLKRQLDLLDSQLKRHEDGSEKNATDLPEGQGQGPENVTSNHLEQDVPAADLANDEDQDQDQVEYQEEIEEKEGREKEAEEPNKGFTSDEIQAFLNNQIRKQHQQHVLEEELEAQHQMKQQQQQQHLILVTQNGDKIILIQNSNGEGDEEGETMTATVEYQPQVEINEEEEIEIHRQHKVRQQMFLCQLDKLREKHRDRPVSTSTGLASKGELMVERAVGDLPETEPRVDDEEWMFESLDSFDDIQPNTVAQVKEKQKQIHSKNVKRKHPKSPKRSDLRTPKWLLPLNANLTLACNYVKRREKKVEQLGKFFPTKSTSFEKRIEDLRQELLKIELSVERFQNTVGKDIEEVQLTFIRFMDDFHLSSNIREIEAEDDSEALEVIAEEQDEADLLEHEACKANKRRREASSQFISFGSGFMSTINLIAPPSVTVTAAADPALDTETSQGVDDFEPEPEIRDKPCDTEDVEDEDTDIKEPFYQETTCRSFPLCDLTPTVSVSQALIQKQRTVRPVRPKAPKRKCKYPFGDKRIFYDNCLGSQYKCHRRKQIQKPETNLIRRDFPKHRTYGQPPTRSSFRGPEVGSNKICFIKDAGRGAVINGLRPLKQTIRSLHDLGIRIL